MEPAPTGPVAAAFAAFPDELRDRLLELRALILATARSTAGVGQVEEALRWGEPSYLTPETKSGSTIRLAPVRGSADEYGMFFNCQTSLVESFRQAYPELKYEGNRAIVFEASTPLPVEAVTDCVEAALTYHLRKKAARRK